jgi:hypothetical protein
LCGLGGRFADYEMPLQTNAVDFYAAGFEGGDEILGRGCFGAGVFDVIVVVVELYTAVVESCGLEGDGDVLGADLEVVS